jgi:hypothetical protein
MVSLDLRVVEAVAVVVVVVVVVVGDFGFDLRE